MLLQSWVSMCFLFPAFVRKIPVHSSHGKKIWLVPISAWNVIPSSLVIVAGKSVDFFASFLSFWWVSMCVLIPVLVRKISGHSSHAKNTWSIPISLRGLDQSLVLTDGWNSLNFFAGVPFCVSSFGVCGTSLAVLLVVSITKCFSAWLLWICLIIRNSVSSETNIFFSVSQMLQI